MWDLKFNIGDLCCYKTIWSLVIILLNAFALKLINIEEAVKKILVSKFTVLYYIKQVFKSKKAFACWPICSPAPHGNDAAAEMTGAVSFLQGILVDGSVVKTA